MRIFDIELRLNLFGDLSSYTDVMGDFEDK